jgi:hypothetical protein
MPEVSHHVRTVREAFKRIPADPGRPPETAPWPFAISRLVMNSLNMLLWSCVGLAGFESPESVPAFPWHLDSRVYVESKLSLLDNQLRITIAVPKGCRIFEQRGLPTCLLVGLTCEMI